MKIKMEYKLLKTIEPNFVINVPNEMMPRLTPFPATDYVNPGVGQITRLYSFYVPLHVKSLHSQTKNEPNVEAQMQEGSGNVEPELINNESDNESENVLETNSDLNPIEYNEQKLKRLGPAVQESFLHPKIFKTGKLSLSSSSKIPTQSQSTSQNLLHIKKTNNENKSNSIKSKTIKHKFQFV